MELKGRAGKTHLTELPIYSSSPKSCMIFFIDSCNGGRSYPLKNPGSLAIPLSYGNHFCQDSPANVSLKGFFHDQIYFDTRFFAQFIFHANELKTSLYSARHYPLLAHYPRLPFLATVRLHGPSDPRIRHLEAGNHRGVVRLRIVNSGGEDYGLVVQ